MGSRFTGQVKQAFLRLFIFFVPILYTNIAEGQVSAKCFARLGNLDSVNIPANVIKAQNAIFVYEVMRVNHWEPLEVGGFQLMIMRSDSLVAKTSNKGGKFETQVKEAIGLSIKGDTILFYKVVGRKHDGSKISVFPLEFTVE